MWVILEKFIIENVLNLLTFPFWWYGRGLREVVLRIGNSISRANKTLGVWLWVSNIFTPMFGQGDWQGRIISFFMRMVQVIVRTIAFAVWCLILVVLLFLWILILPLALYLTIHSAIVI